jgi:hypothetical protein
MSNEPTPIRETGTIENKRESFYCSFVRLIWLLVSTL